MEARLNLASYGVEEVTMAEAQKIDGGILLIPIIAVASAVRIATVAIGGYVVGSYAATVFQGAYIQGRRNAGCICF